MNLCSSKPLHFRYTRGNRPPHGGDGEQSSKSEQMEQGMKLSKVRIGEKFVFDDRGGVWEKVAEGKARCFFGSRDMWNKEIDIPADGYCYIPDFDPRHKPNKPNKEEAPDATWTVKTTQESSSMRVRIVDEENECLVKEMENVSMDKIAALGVSKTIRLTLPGKSKPREYSVTECRCDMDDGTFYVMVTPEEGSDEKVRND